MENRNFKDDRKLSLAIKNVPDIFLYIFATFLQNIFFSKRIIFLFVTLFIKLILTFTAYSKNGNKKSTLQSNKSSIAMKSISYYNNKHYGSNETYRHLWRPSQG